MLYGAKKVHLSWEVLGCTVWLSLCEHPTSRDLTETLPEVMIQNPT